jgi:hypothetical protein
MVLMGTLPINFQTLRTSGEFFQLVKNKVRDFPFSLLPWDFIEKTVTKEASGKKVLLIQ